MKTEDFTLFNLSQLLIFVRKILSYWWILTDRWKTSDRHEFTAKRRTLLSRRLDSICSPFSHSPLLGSTLWTNSMVPHNFWCQDICLRNICLERSMNINLTAKNNNPLTLLNNWLWINYTGSILFKIHYVVTHSYVWAPLAPSFIVHDLCDLLVIMCHDGWGWAPLFNHTVGPDGEFTTYNWQHGSDICSHTYTHTSTCIRHA